MRTSAIFVAWLAVATSGAAVMSAPETPADYLDPDGVFTLAYDAAIWTVKPGADGDVRFECGPPACAGFIAGCSFSRVWVPFGTARRLARSFDAKVTERSLIKGLGKQKAITDKEAADRPADSQDVAPTLVMPYTPRRIGADAHPIHEAELRVSFAGVVNRFIAVSTGARSHSIAIICHGPEDRLTEWRPRSEALIEGFRPGPQALWLRWLERLGL